ncbi:hypothetical protein CBS63078_8285 [Aspergillus niger]|nr:hypothetical protein CBS115989_5224 [Aspergillus niger]KAI2827921.1 hypothetical protein CBS133816_6008 [Aspergillus niger]KAI2841903.1 hypothetical protein CBS11350_6161 [Aspergillus niger]KAI2860419.1 hypothetical protein CBS12448_5260 [Aspergillus niger]KAI2862326.1 hypothetical protein CBS11232_547 [Aspergillus niger]
MAGVCPCFSPWTNDQVVQAHTVARVATLLRIESSLRQAITFACWFPTRFVHAQTTLKNHALVSLSSCRRKPLKNRVGRELVYVFVLRQRSRSPPAAQAAIVSLHVETL